jgi:hypothetical protein
MLTEEQLSKIKKFGPSTDSKLFRNLFTTDEIFSSAVYELLNFEDRCSAHDALSALAQIVFFQNSSLAHGGNPMFIPTTLQTEFQRYIYSWDRLAVKLIAFSDWSDLAEEGLTMLSRLLDTGKLTEFKKDKQYLDFMKRFAARHEELRLQKDYKQLNEFMDD